MNLASPVRQTNLFLKSVGLEFSLSFAKFSVKVAKKMLNSCFVTLFYNIETKINVKLYNEKKSIKVSL